MTARPAGAVFGLAIAAVIAQFDVLGSVLAEQYGSFWSFLETTIPGLLAGAVGGWIFGIRASKTATPRGLLGIVLGYAALAIVIGSFTFALWIAVDPLLVPDANLVEAIPTAVLVWVLSGTLGLVFVGPVAVVYAVPAAIAWVVLMRFRAATPSRTEARPSRT